MKVLKEFSCYGEIFCYMAHSTSTKNWLVYSSTHGYTYTNKHSHGLAQIRDPYSTQRRFLTADTVLISKLILKACGNEHGIETHCKPYEQQSLVWMVHTENLVASFWI